ncbi:MAG TPA: ASCH domain-containing protein [Candidatus Eisenbacteria bacterium]|nr:ASCH domain-containing protein [Candidatus Eisenbacteria bacterium]
MHLVKEPFDKIKNGTKTLEVRLYDEKRQKITVGDTITFSHNNEEVTVIVLTLSHFATFSDLFSSLGIESAGWAKNDSFQAAINDMREYYSEEDEKKYGVLGIHFQTYSAK